MDSMSVSFLNAYARTANIRKISDFSGAHRKLMDAIFEDI